jgi:hypothetical protein
MPVDIDPQRRSEDLKRIFETLRASQETWHEYSKNQASTQLMEASTEAERQVLVCLRDTQVSLREAFLIMFAYVDWYWNDVGRPDEVGQLLSELSLLGDLKPADAAVFPKWLDSAQKVLLAEQTPDGYREADLQLTKDDDRA